MRATLIMVIVSMLVFTLGCNYEYGNYGKDRPGEKTTESISGAGTPTPKK